MLTILALEQVQQARREVVAELRQRLAQLALVDRPGAVAVEVAEDILPVLDVLPEAGELQLRVSGGINERGDVELASLKPIVPLRSVSYIKLSVSHFSTAKRVIRTKIVMSSLTVSRSNAMVDIQDTRCVTTGWATHETNLR